MTALYNIQLPAKPIVGSHLIEKLPILILNIHTQCNCRCVMCDIWKRKDGRSLGLAQVRAHRQSILDLCVEQVVFTGGEPLLNREFEGIAAFFKSLGVHTTLLTTGILLAKNADAVCRYIDDIIVSIDGPAEIHDRIRRVPNGFDRIRIGVERILAANASAMISCRTTVQKTNHAHLRETVDEARRLGLRSISFLAADLSSSAFNRESPWKDERQDEIALTLDEVAELEQEIELLIKQSEPDIRTGFIAESGGKLRRIAARYREYLEGTQPAAPICNAPWKSTVIEVDGSLRPCFFHPIVANINSTTLTQAINAPLAKSFRAGLDIASNTTCQRCVCSLNLRESRDSTDINQPKSGDLQCEEP